MGNEEEDGLWFPNQI